MSIEKPTPIDEEIQLDAERHFITSTNLKGIITSANIYFIKVSGYSEYELIGSPHSIVRHPDMPRIIFKLLWQQIQSGQNMCAVVKNMAKDGRYYWVVTDFEILRDEVTKSITGYRAYRKPASKETVQSMIPIYKRLIEAEKVGGMLASEQEFNNILKEQKMSYQEFINNERKKSGIKAFLGKFGF